MIRPGSRIRPSGTRSSTRLPTSSFRRRGLAVALLTKVFGVLAARGHPDVVCEVDDTNTASKALVTGLGARRVGGTVELTRSTTKR